MKSRLLALTLSLGLLGLPLATPVAAASPEASGAVDAVVVVSEADLPALLVSGYLSEDYSIVSPADVGLDPDAIVGPALFGEDSVLTPTQLGIDTPQWGSWWGGPFWRGFAGSPIFKFRTFAATPIFRPVFTPLFTRVSFPLFGGIGSPFAFTRVIIIVR